MNKLSVKNLRNDDDDDDHTSSNTKGECVVLSMSCQQRPCFFQSNLNRTVIISLDNFNFISCQSVTRYEGVVVMRFWFCFIFNDHWRQRETEEKHPWENKKVFLKNQKKKKRTKRHFETLFHLPTTSLFDWWPFFSFLFPFFSFFSGTFLFGFCFMLLTQQPFEPINTICISKKKIFPHVKLNRVRKMRNCAGGNYQKLDLNNFFFCICRRRSSRVMTAFACHYDDYHWEEKER